MVATQNSGRKRRRMPRRWWLFRPFDLLARFWPVLRRRRGVLIVRIDGIGDMVMFHGAFGHLAQALGVDPASVTLLGCQSWSSIACQLFPGSRFRAIDEHAYDRNPFYRLSVSLWVRRQGFAVALCDSFMRKPLVADSLVYVSGAPRRIVARPYVSPKTQHLFAWYLARCQAVIDTGDYPTHEILRHFRFLSTLAGRPLPPEPPRLPWPARAAPPLAAPYVVLNFGSNEPGRRWDFGRFLALGEDLAGRGYAVVFVGGRADLAFSDRVAHAARASAQPGQFIDRIGQTSLSALLDLLQNAALVVSNDTGPAHLAIGLGVNTVVIVGGGHFTSFVPYPASLTPPGVRFVFRERPCFHCFWGCTEPHRPGDSFPCIATIGDDEVRQAVDALLPQRAPASPACR